MLIYTQFIQVSEQFLPFYMNPLYICIYLCIAEKRGGKGRGREGRGWEEIGGMEREEEVREKWKAIC
jgi:hypothetical protein